MSLLNRVLRPTLPVVLVLGCAVSPGPRAEIAATLSAGNGNLEMTGVISLGIITDDPGPFGAIWQQVQPETPLRRVLNPQGAANGDGNPTILVLPVPGIALVAWSRNSPTGYDVVMSRLVDGAWTAPEDLSCGPEHEFDPLLVRDPSDGTVHLVYWVFDGAPRVMHRSAPADLSSWSAARQVSAPGDIALRPTAVVHGGKLHVIYEVHDLGLEATPRQIVLASQEGLGFDYELVEMTYHAGPNRPTVRATTDRIWVEWVDAESEIVWVRGTVSGTWEQPRTEVFVSPEDRDYHAPTRIKLQAAE